MTSETQPFLRAQGLTLKTPMGPVYTDVSLEANAGQVVAMYGSEGTGRTSLLLTLSGRMRPSSGSHTVGGLDPRKKVREVRNLCNITIVERLNEVPENLKCRDILAAELQLAGKSGRKAKVLEYAQQWHIEECLNTKYRDLGAFDKTSFGLALAFASDPKLLCVDDLQEGLTQHQSIKLVKGLRQLAVDYDCLVLFNCNEYEIARYADGIVVLSEDVEEQRRAVIAAKGSGAACPIFGSGNGVNTGQAQPAADEPAKEEEAAE